MVTDRKIQCIGACLVAALLCALAIAPSTASSRHGSLPTPLTSPFVITLTTINADAAARMLRSLYPRARITVDRDANTLVVSASADDAGSIRQVATGIDTKNPLAPQAQAFSLHRIHANDALARLRPLFPEARFSTVNLHTLLVSASTPTMQQIQTLIGGIDAPLTTPTPDVAATPPATEAVRILSAPPQTVAREVAGALHGLRVSVAGQSVILAG